MSAASPAVDNQSSLLRTKTLALGVFVVSLVVYSLTLAPTVTLVDSGELILAAQSLGVAHPPGFPLYVLLAHLATLFPLGNLAVRVNFASAIFAALASAVVTLVVAEILASPALAAQLLSRKRKRLDREGKKRTRAVIQDPTRAASSHPFDSIIPLVVAGLLLAFSRTVWAYATITEVYTLNTLLIATIFLLMFRWRRRRNETGRRGDTETRREDENGRRAGEASRREEHEKKSQSRPVSARPFVVCRRTSLWISAWCAPRNGWLDAACVCSARVVNRGRNFLQKQAASERCSVCICGSVRGLRLSSDRGFASADHELGRHSHF